jgi:hypothetical protein
VKNPVLTHLSRCVPQQAKLSTTGVVWTTPPLAKIPASSLRKMETATVNIKASLTNTN